MPDEGKEGAVRAQADGEDAHGIQAPTDATGAPSPMRTTGERRRGDGSPQAPRVRSGWRLATGRSLFLLALLVCVVMRGAVAPVTQLGTVVLVGAALFLGALSPPADRRTWRSYALCMVICTGLVLYLLAQAWSYPGNPLANPLWSRVGELPGADVAAISVAPAATRGAISTLAAPFLFYAAALSLFQRDEGGMLLLRWLSVLGAGFALFGILQLALFPGSLLLVEKTAYLDSLTGFFVNRNTAGTFLGVASLALLTLVLCRGGHRERRHSIVEVFTDPHLPMRRKLMLAASLFGLFAVLLALFLTRSRGALLATVIAYLAIVAIHLSRGRDRRVSPAAGPGRTRHRRPVLMALLAGGGVLLFVAIFGELAIYRMVTLGVDEVRLCVYASTLEAIRDNWLFGTGFGTFEFVFPAYRSAGCGFAGSVFLRAHNVYLEGLLGLGVGFLAILAGGLAHVLGNLWQGMRRRRRMRMVPVIGIGSVVLVALHGFVDFSLQIPGMAAFFAAYLAAVTTISLARGPETASLGKGGRADGT